MIQPTQEIPAWYRSSSQQHQKSKLAKVLENIHAFEHRFKRPLNCRRCRDHSRTIYGIFVIQGLFAWMDVDDVHLTI